MIFIFTAILIFVVMFIMVGKKFRLPTKLGGKISGEAVLYFLGFGLITTLCVLLHVSCYYAEQTRVKENQAEVAAVQEAGTFIYRNDSIIDITPPSTISADAVADYKAEQVVSSNISVKESFENATHQVSILEKFKNSKRLTPETSPYVKSVHIFNSKIYLAYRDDSESFFSFHVTVEHNRVSTLENPVIEYGINSLSLGKGSEFVNYVKGDVESLEAAELYKALLQEEIDERAHRGGAGVKIFKVTIKKG